MRILGVDPGLGVTGYGILEEDSTILKIIEAGIIRTKKNSSFEKQLFQIGNEMESIITQLKPDVIAIEELYSHYKHPKTAIIMGHARGIVFFKAAEKGIEVFPYSSTKVKNSLTGNGRASKRQVQQMIASTLNLSIIPEPNDVADALAVALCHLNSLKTKLSEQI
ncbi:MAG: crossover junction endodeoxyribonuclease RuvC [Candidatus Zixiibacteriota bacterium]